MLQCQSVACKCKPRQSRTIQNLQVARIDTERGLLLIRGAVPGGNGSAVVVTPAVKTPRQGAKVAKKA